MRLRMRVRECESAPFSAWSHEGSSTDTNRSVIVAGSARVK